jgi:hypothetical protein
MKSYRVSRNGELKGTYPLEKHTDGTLWNGKNPLLDSEAEGYKTLGKDAIIALIKAGKFAEIPADCFAKEGTSASGLEVIDYEIIRNQEIINLTDAQKERIRINGLFAKAYARQNASDDNNVQDYFIILGQAKKALAAWKVNYPAEAKEEKRDSLMNKAAELRSTAIGALTYDCDGDLTPAMQQARHDELINQARAIEAQAKAL